MTVIKRMLKPSHHAAPLHLPVSLNKRPALVQGVRGGGGGGRGGDGPAERAAGRCAAAAPITGQTPLVCFLQENTACYTSAHTVPVSGTTYTISQKWQVFFFPLIFVCHFWRAFERETLFTPISSMSAHTKFPKSIRRVLSVCLFFIVMHCVTAWFSLPVTLQVI